MEKATLDKNDEQHAKAAERLRSAYIAWFTTVRADGRPLTIPVWFLWEEGGTVLIFSQPNQKVRNVGANQNVTVALDETNEGDDVVVVEGRAELLPEGQADATLSAYVAKYGEGIQGIGMTPETMAQRYNVAIRVTPTRFIIY